MRLKLSPSEARVVGVLLEKQITTPELYPLSLNALTNGCNQKSNREPVMALSESDVQEALDSLKQQRLVMAITGRRTLKYKHRFCNTEFSDWQFSSQEVAILCLMLLRGAQTPGELRTRSARLADFNDVAEVEATLTHLMTHEFGPFVLKLERSLGKREARYAHLFFGAAAFDTLPEQAAQPNSVSQTNKAHADDRLSQLEDRVSRLEIQLADLLD